MARHLSPDCDLRGIVRPGHRIVMGHACGEPTTLAESLMAQRAALGPLSLFIASSFSGSFDAVHADHVRFSSMGAIGSLGRLSKAGILDIIPCHVGRIGSLIRAGTIGCDVAMVQLSPAGPDGTHSFGLIGDHVQAAMDAADILIAEINDQVPWTHGDRSVRPEEIDWIVETSRPPVTMAGGRSSDTDHAIARHASDFIHDGCVLQMGIGAVPEAVTRLLTDRRDLGVHSGMIGDGIMDLMQTGIVTNARKKLEPGVTVTGALVGSERLYRFAHLNPAIGLRDAAVTHGETVLAGIERLVSINSAIEVDLTGQVNGEQAGPAYLGATGGQVDFVRAGVRSTGGRAIIALPATAAGGKASRIVPVLTGPVTTARSEVDVIVTEHGAAELAGRPIRDRVKAMIAVAHPDFREGLERSAHDILKRGF